MPRIVYFTAEGERREHEVPAGKSVMEGAMRHGIPGIEAECGGCLSCATCHVFVDEAWLARTGPPGEIELEMLDMIASRQANSRLSCQIKVTTEVEGLVVRVPADQSNITL